MEFFGYLKNDLGFYIFLIEVGESENIWCLEWLFSWFMGYVGVINYLGEKFISLKIFLVLVMCFFENRGFFYLDDSGYVGVLVKIVVESISFVWGWFYCIFDCLLFVLIDFDLVFLEVIVCWDGFVLGIGFFFLVIICVIVEWVDIFLFKGFVLVFVFVIME